MPNGSREDRSYVDGLPVKITEKYKRPPRIKLPVVCQNCSPSPIISEQYDFRLERSVLSKMEEWKKARLEQSHRQEERRKQLEQIDQAEQSKDTAPTDSQQEEAPAASSATQQAILTPICAGTISEPVLKPLPSYFNFSEFESDNSSPFDNMELKTINEMEVLASVLSSTSDVVPPSGEKTSPSSINNNNIPNKNGVIYNKWEGYNTYSSPQYYEQNYSYPALYSPVMYSQPSQPQWYGGDSIASQPSPYYGSTSTPPPAHHYHVDAGGTIPKVRDESSSLPNQRSNSKSVPDLVLELEEELKEKKFFDEQRRKTKTPPPRPFLLNGSGLENWKPWPELESPHHSGPDAIETLTAPEQVLARNVSEMGFPVARVVRTIKKFQDDKRVIDFLLQVQRLEEESFPGDLAERALHANNYDSLKAKKHLEGAVTLLDLGFDIASIERALIETNNDRDAALERLIS